MLTSIARKLNIKFFNLKQDSEKPPFGVIL
jgi:hypothetical protein